MVDIPANLSSSNHVLMGSQSFLEFSSMPPVNDATLSTAQSLIFLVVKTRFMVLRHFSERRFALGSPKLFA
ncbi:conserved hypothetical protein [delta proteobacterium NaphS2]|nr:conserved hypothetical protein [delta proteobacterium NaphS2]